MKKYLLAAVGLILGAALVWVLFRSTDWDEVLTSIRDISLPWLVLAHVPLLLTFPCRVQRWTYIVRAAHPVSFRKIMIRRPANIVEQVTMPQFTAFW